MKEGIEVDYVGYDHEESQRVVVYVGENDEFSARFNLSDLLDTELDMFKLKTGLTDSAGKPRFDAMELELTEMVRRIRAIRYG
jgi:enoyl-CoA hydratase/carnithine racemase